MTMKPNERKALEAAGFRVGNFDDFLEMDGPEAKEVALRADLGAAIRRGRVASGLTQAAFGKQVGVSQSKLARIEIGAPEVSLDLMTKVLLRSGGSLSIEGAKGVSVQKFDAVQGHKQPLRVAAKKAYPAKKAILPKTQPARQKKSKV